MNGVSKTFSGVTVLKGVSLDVYKGEVHALMGENGAGKSTLIKILSGIYQPDEDEGSIEYKGQKLAWSGPVEAKQNGISVIHQELKLSPNLSIGENILMGTKFPKNRFGLVNWREVHERAGSVLSSMGSDLDPRRIVADLSVAQQQVVEIARALSYDAEVLIMDEPTASLTDKEIDKLFAIIEDLKSKEVGIIYISHRMEEIFRISDRYTVIRDGEWIQSGPITETSPDHLVKLMVGRELNTLFKREVSAASERVDHHKPALELREVSDRKVVNQVSLKVYPGEIVGLAGLVGAGRTELIRTIFGAAPLKSGEVYIDGNRVRISNPSEAVLYGLAHVPESRKEQGLFLNMSVKENIVMGELKKFQKSGWLSWKRIGDRADHLIEELGVKVASSEQYVSELSGGNQQKVVIARWLATNPKVLLLDEPTRGVDIGAKTEIHKIISALAEKGLAVLVVSSELPEVLGISDRILVMHEGRIKGELLRSEASQEKIMHFATGGQES
ncbi:ATP-binding cassette domain-containing protein [Bacillus mangrovi]|uniref:ATP-binding cassette domain-containing protein n=2 Tax=Metabacillus mangrovi TaxID=1491830 RepID=A0A7X2S4F9_9BACI|nr:sugar ABC transporter ATP-binding protein [Metabacillus mangrovi]MTH53499.1 ATP-binding cassette domain-containing protein [Metabacillus mangrovi]